VRGLDGAWGFLEAGPTNHDIFNAVVPFLVTFDFRSRPFFALAQKMLALDSVFAPQYFVAL